MSAYYNEIDPFAAAWLRELIKHGHIAPGDVDERSITDVRAADLVGYRQVHFFAGIGGWSLAVRLAGIPDDFPLWTGSAPCQPFSHAGKQRGTDDERHLWPVMRDLVAECLPTVVAGEQVASRLGLDWLASVRADLEREGYAVGAADLCAASVGAPHVRQRLYWGGVRVADADRERRDRISVFREQRETIPQGARSGCVDRVADAGCERQDGIAVFREPKTEGARSGRVDGLADAGRERSKDWLSTQGYRNGWHAEEPWDSDDRLLGGSSAFISSRTGAYDREWRAPDWLFCRDERWRAVEPGTFPLADGVPARVGRLRGYGNAIVPQVAAAFLTALVGGAA